MIKNKFFILHPIIKISCITVGILGCFATYKFYFKQYVDFVAKKQAEEEANILYEKLREKEER